MIDMPAEDTRLARANELREAGEIQRVVEICDLGGPDVSLRQTNLQATKDLGFAELLAFPLLALLAFLIFRGVAALLPLGVAITSVLGSLVALRLINAGLPLSSFALNVVTGLGLGLSIDHSLILVSRFREELARGLDITAAITTTLQTAGRTVIFSALTVAAAMASLTGRHGEQQMDRRRRISATHQPQLTHSLRAAPRKHASGRSVRGAVLADRRAGVAVSRRSDLHRHAPAGTLRTRSGGAVV
jgi:hypothetical protein